MLELRPGLRPWSFCASHGHLGSEAARLPGQKRQWGSAGQQPYQPSWCVQWPPCEVQLVGCSDCGSAPGAHPLGAPPHSHAAVRAQSSGPFSLPAAALLAPLGLLEKSQAKPRTGQALPSFRTQSAPHFQRSISDLTQRPPPLPTQLDLVWPCSPTPSSQLGSERLPSTSWVPQR